MKRLLPLLTIPLTCFGSGLQQLMPDGSLTFDVSNDDILSMVENVEVDLPGMRKISSGEGAKKVTVEKYDRGSGYFIKVTVGWQTIYQCHVSRIGGKESRYCY